MKKPKERLTAKETLELLNNQWATTEDIMKLAFVGENRAGDIRNELSRMVEEKGKKLPRGLVPMDLLKDYLGINISYLKKISGGN